MFVRLAVKADEDAFVAMCMANVAETLKDVAEPEKFREHFRQYLATSFPTIFVADDKGKAVGLMWADLADHDYKTGFYALQRVLYVSPEKRGTRASVLLVRELIKWAERLGADGIFGGNDNGFQSERTAAFLGHFGFETIGFAMWKRLGENGDELLQQAK